MSNKYHNIKKGFNYDRRKKQNFKNKYEERDKFDPCIYVRNGNVDQAIRALKKRLLKADFQKELAKLRKLRKMMETGPGSYGNEQWDKE